MSKANSFKNLNTDSLTYYINSALIIAESNNDSKQKLDVLFILIENEIKSSRLINAMNLCDSAAIIAKKSNLQQQEIEVQLYYGVIYQAIGFTSKALEVFVEAKKLIEAGEPNLKEADLYYYLALLYYNIGEIDECHKYLKLSLNSVTIINPADDIFSVYILLTNVFNNIDSIQRYLNKAEHLLVQNPELLYEKVALHNNMAVYYKAIKNYNLSREHYTEAINISKNKGFQNFLSNTYNNYAYLLMAESKYDSAKYYLDEALDIAIEIKSLDMESEIYDSYSDYYEKIGDYKKALAYTDLFIQKRDKYRQQQQIQKFLFLSAVFETEQKEKQILEKENKITRLWLYMAGVFAILAIAIGLVVYFRQKFSLSKSRLQIVQKGKSLEIANAHIFGQDNERKRLAMDLHDGLAARLSALIIMFDGFFNTHKRYGEVSIFISDIHKYVRDLSHRMAPPELENMGLHKAIRNLVSSINMSGKFKVHYETNFQVRLPEKLEINIYFLIYELLNNAIRHSKGDTIFVQLIEDDDVINLSVEDNGGGFITDKNNEGMGLKNIRNRVQYLDGIFNFESNDSDTIFMIELPNK
ncbi:MAG: histidine kinase [Bacteroidota bacterium]